MKHICLTVAVAAIFGLSLMTPAMADSQTSGSSSSAYEQDHYSPPLGGEGCSTTKKEKPIS